MTTSKETELKGKALDVAVSQLEKQFGRGTLVRLGDDSFHHQIPVIPSGSLSQDCWWKAAIRSWRNRPLPPACWPRETTAANC